MQAITIRNPWSWMIVNGVMDIIMSNIAYAYRGPLLIYSATKPGPASEFVTARNLMRTLAPAVPFPGHRKMRRGGLVGMVDLVDVVQDSESPWFAKGSGYGLVVKNAQVLNFVPNTPDIVTPSLKNGAPPVSPTLISLKGILDLPDLGGEEEGVMAQKSGKALLATLIGERQ